MCGNKHIRLLIDVMSFKPIFAATDEQVKIEWVGRLLEFTDKDKEERVICVTLNETKWMWPGLT